MYGLTVKISLKDTDKFFLIDISPKQPIEPIIRECYFQLMRIRKPTQLQIAKARLYLPSPEPVYLKFYRFNDKWGSYKIPDGGLLIFEGFQ